MVAEGANREEYNLYTFKAPCEECELGTQEHGGRGEKAELEQYLTVVDFWRKIQSDALSKTRSKKAGLNAIKYKTQVDLNAVKKEVNREENMGKKRTKFLGESEVCI